jgi:O-antigen ligase
MYVACLAMIIVLPFSFALIEVCQLTMIAAWAYKCFLLCKAPVRQEDRPRGFNFLSSSMGWSLIAIALLIVLTVPFSHYPSLSIKKFFTRFLQQVLLMYFVTQVIQNRKRLYGVLAVLLLTLFLVIVDVVAQYISGYSLVHHKSLIYGRVSGSMNHPNDLGTLLVTVLPVVLVLAITCRRWIPLLWGHPKPLGTGMSWVGIAVISVLFLLLLNVLGLTASRGAWVAFAVSMVAFCICLKNYKLTIFAVLVLMVFFWVFGWHCLKTRTDVYNAPITHGAVIHPSFTNPFGLPPGYNALDIFFNPDGRQIYWGTAVRVIKHYPWFGCGYNTYVQTLHDLHVGHEEDPHNSLLHITAELGMVGLILYGWFFIALFLQINNVLRAVSFDRDLFLLGCGISSGILAWLIHSLLDTVWTSYQLNVLWWLFIGILLSLGVVITNRREEKPCP